MSTAIDEDDDRDLLIVPQAEVEAFLHVRGVAALQHVLVSARRSDAGIQYAAQTIERMLVADSLSELRAALIASGVKLPTIEVLRARAAGLRGYLAQAAHDGTAPNRDH